MLIKEYRIPVPMTVDEYRIAQLYMIVVSEIRESAIVDLMIENGSAIDFCVCIL